MIRKRMIVAGVIACAIAVLTSCTPAPQAENTLQTIVELQATRYEMPSLAVVVILDGEIAETAVTGVRVDDQAQSGPPATIDDLYHIGSNTKALTSILAATLVDDGLIEWTSTLDDLLGDLIPQMRNVYRRATLRQLLAHTAGIADDLDYEMWQRGHTSGDPPHLQRLEFAESALSGSSVGGTIPGESYSYSNYGYMIAALMLEEVAGQTYEELMAERVLEPLGMTTAGWGPPCPPRTTDQPWGHSDAGQPVDPSSYWSDNPPAFNSAGRLHCSSEDLARFLICVINEGRLPDGSRLISEDSYRELTTPYLLMNGGISEYKGGWVIEPTPDDEAAEMLIHAGSNTMFFSYMAVVPERRFGVVANTNIGADEVGEGVGELVALLIDKYDEQQE